MFADPAVGTEGGGYSNGSEKSVTLYLTCFKTLFFLLVISRVINLDKTCKLGHSPAEVKLLKILNAGSCFGSFTKCFHRAANPDVHRCMETSTCMDSRQWLKEFLEGFPCHQFLKRKNREAPLKLPRLPNARSISSNLGRLARLPSAATEGLDANIRELTRLMSSTVTFSEENKKRRLCYKYQTFRNFRDGVNGTELSLKSSRKVNELWIVRKCESFNRKFGKFLDEN